MGIFAPQFISQPLTKVYKPQQLPLNCHFFALGQGVKVAVYEASRKNLKIEWHFFFSNTISMSAQLCFKNTLACLGMNHVIKDERPQITGKPRGIVIGFWETAHPPLP